jgi:hypothetical protein
MGLGQSAAVALRIRLIQRLVRLGVEHREVPGRDDGFSGLRYNGENFAHFHSFSELDLRLTRAVIAREGLTHPPDSTVHPSRGKGSHWLEVRFSKPEDLDRVVRLVQLAVEQLQVPAAPRTQQTPRAPKTVKAAKTPKTRARQGPRQGR